MKVGVGECFACRCGLRRVALFSHLMVEWNGEPRKVGVSECFV